MTDITNQCAHYSFLFPPSSFSHSLSFLYSFSFLPNFLPPSSLPLTHHSKMVRGRSLQLLLAMTKNNLSGVLLAFDCSKTFFIYSHFILHTKPGNQQEKTLELKNAAPSCPDPNLSHHTGQLTLLPIHQEQYLEHQEARGPDRHGPHPGPGSQKRGREG